MKACYGPVKIDTYIPYNFMGNRIVTLINTKLDSNWIKFLEKFNNAASKYVYNPYWQLN